MPAKLSRKEKIELVVSDVIAEHGFGSAMNDLLPAVRNLAAISLADPENRAKEREFQMWSKAVKKVCERLQDGTALHEGIGDSDAFHAHGMSILLT
jgi:hypothetical protein